MDGRQETGASQNNPKLAQSKPELDYMAELNRLAPARVDVPHTLTIDFVVENKELVHQNNVNRGYEIDLDPIVDLANARRNLIQEVEALRRVVNQASKKGGRLSSEDINQLKDLKPQIAEREASLKAMEAELHEKFSWIPNLLAPEVPIGPPTENKVLYQVGEPRTFSFKVRDHADICEAHDLVDFERATKVAGRGFAFIKNELFLMRQALVNLFINHVMEQGFVPMSTPVLASPHSLYGTGYRPWQNREAYDLEHHELSLIGTSEQSMIAQHMGEILSADSLPLKYVADTQCFRTEAGSHGKDTRGLIRLHQFGKVEQIIFAKPEQAEELHLQALANEEWLLKQLGIPYQVLLMSSEDIAAPGHKKYDIEIWVPSQNCYRELTSNTNLTDFQARRLDIRYRDPNTRQMVHPFTISATGFSDRILVGILENFQEADGSVVVPEVLRPWMGGVEKIGHKSA